VEQAKLIMGYPAVEVDRLIGLQLLGICSCI